MTFRRALRGAGEIEGLEFAQQFACATIRVIDHLDLQSEPEFRLRMHGVEQAAKLGKQLDVIGPGHLRKRLPGS